MAKHRKNISLPYENAMANKDFAKGCDHAIRRKDKGKPSLGDRGNA